MHLRLMTSRFHNSHPGAVVREIRRKRSPKTSPTRPCFWKLAIRDRLESLLARRITAYLPPQAVIRVASHLQPPSRCNKPTSYSGHHDQIRPNQNLVSLDLLPRSSRRKHMLAQLGGDALKRHHQQPSPTSISLILLSPRHSHQIELPHLRLDHRQHLQLLFQCGLRLQLGPYRPYLRRLCNRLTAIARKLQMRISGATMQLHTKVSLLHSTCSRISTRLRLLFAVTER